MEMDEIKNLQEENARLNDELLSWKEYTQKILRLVKTFRNDYVIMQTKCIQNIENHRETADANIDVNGFTEFLRGKLHTITEVINDFHIINSIKFVDDTNYGTSGDKDRETEDSGVEERKDEIEPLRLLTPEEVSERENGKIMNFFGVNYTMA